MSGSDWTPCADRLATATLPPGYRIGRLADRPDLVPVIADWHWREWGHADPAGSVESWAARLRGFAGSELPTMLVGFVGDEPIGTVSLVVNDMASSAERWQSVVRRWRSATPWLSGLYVLSAYRGAGVGSSLIRACEREANDRGVRRLHLFSAGAIGLYARHGYVVIGREFYEDEDVAVMAKDLQVDGR